MWEVLLDSFIDSLKVLPFLILLYIAIELMEEKVSTSTKFLKYTQGKCATLIGASLGLIPQCGFSVVASDLYSRKYIKVGTMLAIFIATSDEAIPIILSNPTKAYLIFPILAVKFLFAIIVGYGIDFVLRKHYANNPLTALKPAQEHNHLHDDNEDQTKTNDNQVADLHTNIDGCCGHEIEGNRNTLKKFFIHPLIHSLKIFAYIFAINLVLGMIIFFVGENNVISFMQTFTWLQPLVVGIVGLIPNCASSVLITQLFLLEGISFGAAVAGLSVNAGIAIAVLFKQNKNIKHNLLIVGGLLLLSIALGYAIMGVMLCF